MTDDATNRTPINTLSPIGRFRDRLSVSVKDSVGDVSGFDVGILIPILLDILVDMLGKCGNARETVKDPHSFAAQYAARKAVRVARDRSGSIMNSRDQAKVASCLLKQCEDCDDDELDRILDEADDVRIDYDLF